jgi:membrane protease YdiL (CAAX protease family)
MENDVKVLGLAMVLGLILASIIAWCICIARDSIGTLFRYVPRKRVPWGLIDLGLAMMVITLTSSIAGVLLIEFGILEQGKDIASMTPEKSAIMMLASSVAMLVGVVLSLGLICLKNRPRLSDLGWSIQNISRDVWVGLVAFLLISAPVYAIQYLLVEILKLPSEHPLIELVKKDPDSLIVAVGAAVVIAPFTEEFLFRVLLQGWLERIPGHRGETRILLLGGAEVVSEAGVAKTASQKSIEAAESRPAIWPVVVSSAVFALMHYSHGVDPIPLFVLALGLGFVYRQTHSILPCIIVHLLFNAFSLALLMVDVYG